MDVALFLVVGLAAGVLAGLFGVGGGLVIVPALVLVAGFAQRAATGTSLVALLAPVGLGGVYAFYRAGKLGPPQVKAGLLISLGMFLGSYVGERAALLVPEVALKRAFCLFLVAVAIRLWLTTMGSRG